MTDLMLATALVNALVNRNGKQPALLAWADFLARQPRHLA